MTIPFLVWMFGPFEIRLSGMRADNLKRRSLKIVKGYILFRNTHKNHQNPSIRQSMKNKASSMASQSLSSMMVPFFKASITLVTTAETGMNYKATETPILVRSKTA